jgi:hypothetical protein
MPALRALLELAVVDNAGAGPETRPSSVRMSAVSGFSRARLCRVAGVPAIRRRSAPRRCSGRLEPVDGRTPGKLLPLVPFRTCRE